MKFDQLKRRELIMLLGGGVAAWPVASRAQPTKSPARIGFLPLGSPSSAYDRFLVEAFRQGLRQAGLIENRDITLDIVWITKDADQAVTELLQRGADILVPCGTSASLAARRHSLTIPIVFINVGNPIAVGLVENLARPGGNATGFSDLLADLSRKHVDLAREVSKPQSVVDYLWHTGWADGRNRANVTEQAAQSAGVQLRSHSFADITEMDNLFAAMERDAATTLIIQPGPYTFQHRHRLIGSATDHGLATISAFPWAADGALIGYGADFVHMYRRAPFYVARVLKGTAPADLPVEQPSHIELAVNLNTAKTLRLELPLSLLVRANNLIE